MRSCLGVVRRWAVVEVSGDEGSRNAASLTKQVLAHLALAVLDDLNEPIWREVSARHVLTHTSGLPNWRDGEELRRLLAAALEAAA